MENILKLPKHTMYVYDFEVIDSRTYMLWENEDILLIDPCVSDALQKRLLGVKHALVYLTHEHYDHIHGVNWLKQKLDCDIWCTDCCAKRMADPRTNLSRTFPLLFLQDKEKYQYVREHVDTAFTCTADHTFTKEQRMTWRGHSLYIRETAGHSPGGSMLLLDDDILFSGDSLLGNGLELKSLGADMQAYKELVLPFAKTLDPQVIVCPGHGEVTFLGDILQKIAAYIP